MTVQYADRVSLLTQAEGRAGDVLYYLAVHADAEQTVRDISLQTIADHFRVSWAHAKRLVRQLRQLGELETLVRGSGKRKNTYRITFPPVSSLSSDPHHRIP